MAGNASIPRNTSNSSEFNPRPHPRDAGLHNDPTVFLTKVFVYFLQNLFRDFPKGSGMMWAPSEEDTEIVISAEKPSLEALEKRPHITCVFGGYSFSGMGFDQMQDISVSQGIRTHTDLVSSSVTFHVAAKNGMNSRRIAYNAAHYTNILKKLIIKAGGLFMVGPRINVTPEGPPSQYQGQTVDPDLIESRVTVPFYWQPQWRITDPGKVWSFLELSVRAHTNFSETSAVEQTSKLSTQ